jgi:hypothetical protein
MISNRLAANCIPQIVDGTFETDTGKGDRSGAFSFAGHQSLQLYRPAVLAAIEHRYSRNFFRS